MKKKFLISLLAIVICVMLSGCEDKNNSNNSLNGKTNQPNESTNNNNSSDDTIIDDDDEILDIEDEDNTPIAGENVNVTEVVNCDGCVFAYFSDEGDKAKRLGSTLSASEYTNDIRTLKTSGGKQRHNFFGLVLSGNTISKAYSCILKDSKIYCIQGSTDGAYHTNNIGILNQIFGAANCKTLSDGHNYWCTDGSYNGNSKTSGYTALHYETSCTIYGKDSNTGKLICH